MSNFLGLIIQLLFAPAEETALILFSSRKAPDLNALSHWLQIMLSLGTLTIVGSQIAGWQAITLLYSDKWASQTSVELLQAYAVHVFCCALNGMSEAYINAKADSETLKKLRGLLVFNSFLYLWMCYIFAVHPGYFGFKGLIYANCFSMAVRATASLYFATQHEHEYTHKKKRPFFSNLIATLIWVTRDLFLGKVYLLFTIAGVMAIFIAHYYILPWTFGSLWQL